MNVYRFTGFGLVFITLLGFGGKALAHHSYGNYQIGTEIQLQGVVTKLGLTNPHSWVFMDAEGENGEIDSWALEGASIAAFRRAGWDALATGDTIDVKCVPRRTGDKGCYIRDIKVIASNAAGASNATGVDSNVAAVEEPSWERISYPDQNFRVNFPHEPTMSRKPYLSEYGGTFSSTIYEASEGDSQYSVTVVDFSNAKEVYEALAEEVNVPGVHNFWLYMQLGAIAYTARQFRLRGGDVTYDAWHAIDFNEGHQMSITNADNTRTYAGIYRHADRLFVLEATLPAGAPSPAAFLESLHILDDEGERVRYVLQPDHSRVRADIEAQNRARAAGELVP